MSEKNVCPICGGFTGGMIVRQLPAMNRDGVPYPIAPVPPVKLCPGEHETEICQILGNPLYVRLDWRDPEIAKYELERIRLTVKDACGRAYGTYEPDTEKEHING